MNPREEERADAAKTAYAFRFVVVTLQVPSDGTCKATTQDGVAGRVRWREGRRSQGRQLVKFGRPRQASHPLKLPRLASFFHNRA